MNIRSLAKALVAVEMGHTVAWSSYSRQTVCDGHAAVAAAGADGNIGGQWARLDRMIQPASFPRHRLSSTLQFIEKQEV